MRLLTLKYTDLKDAHDAAKKATPDAVCVIRLGDFYETLGNDAEVLREVCGVSLTRTKAGDLLGGFPFFSLEQYVSKLRRDGHDVTIVEREAT